MKTLLLLAVVVVASALPVGAAQPVVLTNHLGYERTGPKRAVVQGHKGDVIRSCAIEDDAGQRVPTAAPQAVGAVAHWRDWLYWTVSFDDFARAGRFRVSCATSAGEVHSFPFLVGDGLLERHTLSDVIYYFKGQRCSGPMDRTDRNLRVAGTDNTVDAHGGWYDATGDYGKHLSHLSFSTYFNPQQIPLTAWALLKAHELLERRADPSFRQYLRRLLDEGAWGADYLVRVHAPGGSFYQSVSAPGPGKKPEDRDIARDSRAFAIQTAENRDQFTHGPAVATGDDVAVQSSLRSGAGMAIAALARAAAMAAPGERQADYLATAELAWAFLATNNARFTNDGHENIVDDYCSLLAASELYGATRKLEYKSAADTRAAQLIKRLAPGPKAYWVADDKDRPFFHAADAGLPVVSLLAYAEVADAAGRAAALRAVRRSLEWELAATSETANPFGYARQLVQTTAGVRDTRFFYPHDTETAPWWQGENARLASLAFAARLAEPYFAQDAAFAGRLSGYAQDQLNWILGLNPFDVSMLRGQGRNNPDYLFFGSYEYTNAPGSIVNGITAGFADSLGIDFNLPHTVTGADNDWRWVEQWLPHATWYLLAAAAGDRSTAAENAPSPAIIAYVFSKDRVVKPEDIAADKLTHINYAFGNIADGKVVEGFANDAENYRVLTGLRREHPQLKVLVSVGGWTWSGGFSDMALTPDSRQRFVDSAIAFLRRHDLDGIDIDWEYPGLPGDGNTHRPADVQNFTALMTELRAALTKAGAAEKRRYFLTFAAGANVPESAKFLELDKLQTVVDFVNLMTYDFREPQGDPLAGHHSNLFTHPADDKRLSADRAVREYLAAGVPPGKLVLGVPFYGKAWGDVAPEGHGLYQPGKPPSLHLDTSYGNLALHVVDKDGYVRYWDEQSQAPYLWNAEKRAWIGYDDPESLRVKCRYLRDRSLGGVMFWQYFSDSTGELVDTLYKELKTGGGR